MIIKELTQIKLNNFTSKNAFINLAKFVFFWKIATSLSHVLVQVSFPILSVSATLSLNFAHIIGIVGFPHKSAFFAWLQSSKYSA